MPQSKSINERLQAALSGAALRTADFVLRQGRGVVAALNARGGRVERASEQVASRLRTVGERLIAKSPIPVPVVAKDAFGRMQEALGQLEHVILSGDTSSLRQNQGGNLHKQGKIDVQDAGPQLGQGGKTSQQRPRAHN